MADAAAEAVAVAVAVTVALWQLSLRPLLLLWLRPSPGRCCDCCRPGTCPSLDHCCDCGRPCSCHYDRRRRKKQLHWWERDSYDTGGLAIKSKTGLCGMKLNGRGCWLSRRFSGCCPTPNTLQTLSTCRCRHHYHPCWSPPCHPRYCFCPMHSPLLSPVAVAIAAAFAAFPAVTSQQTSQQTNK